MPHVLGLELALIDSEMPMRYGEEVLVEVVLAKVRQTDSILNKIFWGSSHHVSDRYNVPDAAVSCLDNCDDMLWLEDEGEDLLSAALISLTLRFLGYERKNIK